MHQERQAAFNAGAGAYPVSDIRFLAASPLLNNYQNDMMQWFIEEAPERASDEDIIQRVLAVHITIVHSSPTVRAPVCACPLLPRYDVLNTTRFV